MGVGKTLEVILWVAVNNATLGVQNVWCINPGALVTTLGVVILIKYHILRLENLSIIILLSSTNDQSACLPRLEARNIKIGVVFLQVYLAQVVCICLFRVGTGKNPKITLIMITIIQSP